MKRLKIVTRTLEELGELFEGSIRHDRAMAPPVPDLMVEERCALVISCGQRHFKGEAIVRWIPPRDGEPVGVEIDDQDGELKAAIEQFLESPGTTVRGANHEQRTVSLVHQFKGMPLAKLMLHAKQGDYNERVALERMYGKTLWEALLRNPKITAPEVAKIARKGTIPRGLIDTIVSNKSWCRNPTVRRALLANPKLGIDGASKILRLTPKSELRMIPQQTVYSLQVRQLAKKMITG